MLEFVAETAREAGLEDYRVIVNVGEGAGQTVFHLHWHVLGGGRASDEPDPRIEDELKSRCGRATSNARDALRLTLASLRAAEKELQRPLHEDEELQVLQRERKRRVEAAEAFRAAGREEQADAGGAGAEIIEEFMPEPVDEAELERIVDDAIAETGATSIRDLGRVMADVMPQVAGRADGSTSAGSCARSSPRRPDSWTGARHCSRCAPIPLLPVAGRCGSGESAPDGPIYTGAVAGSSLGLQRGRGRARDRRRRHSRTRCATASALHDPPARQPADARGRGGRRSRRPAPSSTSSSSSSRAATRSAPAPSTRSLAALEQSRDLRDVFEDVVWRHRGKKITPKTVNQKRYVDAIRNHTITFGIGPAGTGKTYLAMALAVAALAERQVSRIILTRPAVEAGERLGFLPGDMLAKVDPYLRPLYDALYDMLDADRADAYMERGHDRGRAARVHARPHAERLVHHPRRGAEHDARADADVPDAARLRLEGRRHRRRHPDRPAARAGLRPHPRARDPRRRSTGSSSSSFGNEDVVRHVLVQRIVEAYKQHAEETGTQRPPVIAVEVDEPERGRVDGRRPRSSSRARRSPRRASSEGDLGIAFVGPDEMRALKREHLGIDEATDVLSFPIDGRDALPDGVPRQLGDVVSARRSSATEWRGPLVARPAAPARLRARAGDGAPRGGARTERARR